ncbi:hypothetical protein [Marinobacter sp. MBR-105]|jgi:hypothetical protein
MEVRTSPLSESQLQQEIDYLAAFLTREGIRELHVAFGWDCNLSIDDMWQYQPLNTEKLSSFLSEAEERGIFTLGRGDLFFRCKNFEFVLCHEADIHLESFQSRQIEFEERWFNLGYEPYSVLARGST